MASWRNHCWALLTWVAVCSVALAYPAIVHMREEYYLRHAVAIPLWERALMGAGEFVGMFQIPIIVGAAAIILVISSVTRAFSRSA